MLQAESQLQLRVQELGSARDALKEAQAALAAVISDRDELRQALSNQDKAMQAMKAYIGTIATAPAPAPAAALPPSAAEHTADSSVAKAGISQQVLEALEAQLKAAKQVCIFLLFVRHAALQPLSACRYCWSRTVWASSSRRKCTSLFGDGGPRSIVLHE
jgi:hypothetical protein